MVVVEETSCILRNYEPTWTQRIFTKLLQCGPMPRHVAFIMDGNRRFAREQNLEHVWEGHRLGGEKMQQVANMLIDLGVEEMTVFSFSTENYKRSPEEVEALMQLVTDRTSLILEGMEELCDLGVHVEVVGNWEKIQSAEMKSIFAKTCLLSKEHKKLKLHLAFAYSAQDEICEGINILLDGMQDGSLDLGNLDESLFNDCLSLFPNNHAIDILIRTGGDCRYSDFQLWQASSAYLDFVQATWPEYGYGDLLAAIWRYQRQVTFLPFPVNGKTDQGYQEIQGNFEPQDTCPSKRSRFIEKVRENKWKLLKKEIVD